MAYTQERSKTDAVAEAFNIKVPILPGVNDCDSVVSDCALRIILSHSYLNKLFANIAKGLRAIAPYHCCSEYGYFGCILSEFGRYFDSSFVVSIPLY